MTEVERIAKMIVGALYGPVNADLPVASDGLFTKIAGFTLLPDPKHTMPLWRVFEPAAIVIVADRERIAEADAERFLTQP